MGFSVLGDYSQPNPPARIVEAVAAGSVDAALVWGPLAGYFAARQEVPLVLAAIPPDAGVATRPFAFDVSMAVRRGDHPRLALLEAFIERRRTEIDRLLASYGVPRVDAAQREGA